MKELFESVDMRHLLIKDIKF